MYYFTCLLLYCQTANTLSAIRRSTYCHAPAFIITTLFLSNAAALLNHSSVQIYYPVPYRPLSSVPASLSPPLCSPILSAYIPRSVPGFYCYKTLHFLLTRNSSGIGQKTKQCILRFLHLQDSPLHINRLMLQK